MKEHGLTKAEKLCSQTLIDKLFNEGKAFIAYPYRIVYRIEESSGELPSFFISIPKRNFKRAVKRVLLRRRTREAYRLHKQIIAKPLVRQNRTMQIAFLYLDKKINEYALLERKMTEALQKLATYIENTPPKQS